MKTLYVIRHGQTQWNVEGRMQGRLDSSLTEIGKQQAQKNGALINALGGVDALYVSPLGRTQETAFILNSQLKAAIEFVDVLEERDCGDWSGMTLDQVETLFPQQWQARNVDPYGYRPPGGENHADLLQRVTGFLEQLYGSIYERIGLVTHGVLSRAIHQYYLGLSSRDIIRMKHPNNVIYALQFNAANVEVHHFQDGQGPTPGLYRLPALDETD